MVGTMQQNSVLNAEHTSLVLRTISKNAWCDGARDVRLDVWSNFGQSPELLRNYLCKDGSGYIRGYYDCASRTFYILRFHLRDEEWTEAESSPTPTK